MNERRLPVRPNLDQLRRQAKELLRGLRGCDAGALEALARFHPGRIEAQNARLADAQLVVARQHGAPSWPRLVQACELIDAIWRDDAEAVRGLIERSPSLLHEDAAIRESSWGPPMSYAANLGRDRIIRMLHGMGARDHARAIGRAALQGKTGTARMLHDLSGTPPLPDDALAGPAYTLNVAGTALMLELGAKVRDERGRRLAPVDVVLETDSRNPAAKHEILELYARHGVELPDTAPMAVHRGRVDLLEAHLRRDPGLLARTFTHEEIYPPELGCHDEVLATHGTPLAGATLLHLCVDFDDAAIARWLLKQGMDVDAPARVDAEGFGGHTALFATVVSQPNYWTNRRGEQSAPLAALLLKHGADPNQRASLRKRLHPGYAPRYDVERVHEYRDVTPLGWGRRFHAREFVSEGAMRLIEARGGRE